MDLSTPLAQLPGIGPTLQRRLRNLKLNTARDLLFHFPHRYEDFSNLTAIENLKLHQNICIQGEIAAIESRKTWKRRMTVTEALVKDKTGSVIAVWFNRPYLTKILHAKDTIILAGKTAFGENGVYLANPSYEKIKPEETGIHTGRLVPVYPETEGLSSRWLRVIIKSLLTSYGHTITDTIPETVQKDRQLLPIQKAIWQIHFPDSEDAAKKAKERFAFQELFHISIFVFRERAKLAQNLAAAIPINLELMQKFVRSFPFQLTDAQKKSAWQILKDLEKPRPMNRLLQGDVGSGKTIVALIGALNAIRAGYQVAFMAPTEILATQHFQTAKIFLEKYKVRIGLLTGKKDQWISPKLPRQTVEISRAKLLEKAKLGEIDLILGTHALIQDKVKFGMLALVILDEQHRFGVQQRARLLAHKHARQTIPHLLSMTATPIPRTLALTIYGDLDLSLINELPKGRRKIITKIVDAAKRANTYDFIRKEAQKKRQIFVICPRIENPEENQNASPRRQGKTQDVRNWSEVKAVKAEYEKLAKEIFPDLKVGMLHGKIASKEKERIMRDFKNGKTDILVSTSVVEVGVDIPNATVIMIEGAERFGLAQLHQFRGRVGRSKHQSYCFLLTESPAGKTRQRLTALMEHESGFELAEKDMAIRGPGDFSGTRQWGMPDLIMDSLKDITLVEKARETAKEILKSDPYLKKYPPLKAETDKFRERIHLE